MDMNNIYAIDTSLLSAETLEKIRATGLVGKAIWFANISDDEAAYSVFDQKDGTATQIQVVPSPNGRLVISRRNTFLKLLSSSECSALRSGRNILSIPYADEDPIVAGAPAEREVYFIDRNTMRVEVIIY